MLVYAGIDEAGYGPLLGPLCIGASVFVLPDHDPASGPPDLWRLLDRCVCRSGGDRRGRVAVEDSKRLKGANDAKAHPLRHLERGVLAFAAATGAIDPEALASLDDRRLFDVLRCQAPDRAVAPWYEGSTKLPLAHEIDQMGIAASLVRRGLSDAGVECSHLACTCIDAGEFNRRLALSRNKSIVSFDAIVALVEEIWRRWPEAHPRVVVDRQGGRMMYREPLALAFPGSAIAILGETERVSRYRLERDGSPVTISFEAESEGTHLPTALASMTAKLCRELLMRRLNEWFARHRPGVRPTAGYVQDGRRWLKEMSEVLDALRVDRAALIRHA